MASTQKSEDESSANTATTSSHTPPSSMLKGASLLIILQLTSRLVTFIANQLLLRYLTAPLLGLATQLEVYYLSVLFFARESLRVAIQRHGIPDSDGAATQGPAQGVEDNGDRRRREGQAVVNLGYLAVALGAVSSVILGSMYLKYATVEALTTPYLGDSLKLYGVAAMVELLSEPCFVLMQIRLEFGARATAESLATFLRCVVVLGTAVYAEAEGWRVGVLPFALGQMTYGVVLLLVYLVSGRGVAAREGFSLLPRRMASEGKEGRFVMGRFYQPTLRLGVSMMAQSLFKHLLTQGDTLLVSVLASPKTQGVYALANNYGSLFARLLFQPVEESSRTYFSRLLSGPAAQMRVPAGSDPSAKVNPAVLEAKNTLNTILRLYATMGLVVISLGPLVATPLLALVAGQQWKDSQAGFVLGYYCLYIPFLAVNGVLEAFVASVATETQLFQQSVFMGLFSLIYAGAAVYLLKVAELGAQGLIVANLINMGLRIYFTTGFTTSFFQKRGLEWDPLDVVPMGMGVVGLLNAYVVKVYAQLLVPQSEGPLMQLVYAVGVNIPLVLFAAFSEREIIQQAIDKFRGQKQKAL